MVSEPPDDLIDPVVVIMPIKWMRTLIKKHPMGFKILINNLVSDGQFDEYGLDKTVYTNSNAAQNASTDDILGWARATKEMMLMQNPNGSSWDFIRKNTPTDVMMGFDMEIGGDGDGRHIEKLIKSLPENVDNLVFPLHDGEEGVIGLLSFMGSNHLDNEKTIRMTSGSADYPEVSLGEILEPAVDEFLQDFTMLPKGLYKIRNLSDMDLGLTPSFFATINYHKLKI